MLNRSKCINIICSLIISLIFAMALLLTSLLLSGVFSTNKPKLIVYSDSNEKLYDGYSLTDHGWRMEGELKSGHQAEAVFRGSRTDAGESENTMALVIQDELGTDVTSDYNIEYRFGTLTVEPRRLLITGETNGITDGELNPAYYQISSGCDGLVNKHNVAISFEEGIPNVVISNASNETFTKNYYVILQLDGNTFFPQNSEQNVAMFKVYSEIKDTVYLKINSYGDYLGQEKWAVAPVYDKLIDDKYSASYLTSMILSSQENNKPVSLQIESLCGYYALPYYMLDGDYQIQTGDTMYKGSVSQIYSVNYYDYPASVSNTKHPYSNYEKEYRNFVYENYLNLDETSREYMRMLIEKQDFSASDPEIIKKVARFIQNAAVYNLDYPRELEKEPNVAIAFLEEYKEGVCRHYAISATLLFRALGIPARYCVGAMAMTEAGCWTEVPSSQAHAWVEVYLDGIGWVFVEVTGSSGNGGNGDNGDNGDTDDGNKPVITIKPVTSRYRYDGESHFAKNQVAGLESLLANGYTYRAEVVGQRTEAGKTSTEIKSIRIYDPTGADVTDQYEFKLQKGLLQIYYEKLTFQSETFTKIYDGKKILSLPNITCDATTTNKLTQANLTVGYQRTDISTDIGVHLNAFSVNLYQDGEKVTDCYWIDYKFGIMNILPIEITLQAGTAEKVYDGTELTCHEYTLADGVLAQGHYVGKVEYSGSQTDVGRSENKIMSVVIYDQNGNDVTKNYSIQLLSGQLRVTRRK